MNGPGTGDEDTDSMPRGLRGQPIDVCMASYVQSKTDSPSTKRLKLEIEDKKAETEFIRATAESRERREMMEVMKAMMESMKAAK